MNWKEITIKTNKEGAELIPDAFFSVGFNDGIRIIDKNDIIDILNDHKFWDYYDPNILSIDDYVYISGFVKDEEYSKKLEELKTFIKENDYPIFDIATSNITDEDWYNNWKKNYKPIEIGKFLIVPKWINFTKEGLIKIIIDPGMAFGTGTHESTRMCLKLLSSTDLYQKDVIDVGTGSGILGIAAIKSGSKFCYMCDIDEIAVKAADENLKNNGITNNYILENSSLLESNVVKKSDIVIGNLTANILKLLQKEILSVIKEEGIFICSGIINEYKDEIIDIYSNIGFKLVDSLNEEDWNALKFVYKGTK
ncbi:MAG: 50S ribosomal protein L11 methyltransferase [Clostridia bacterium]|nr:50S ribosomal protein L11 methyltransferase [Clostridia bacterium]